MFPVLVPAIESTFNPCVPRLCARHRVNLVAMSWCPPSSQPCVPRLGARHRVPCGHVLVPTIVSTLCSPSWCLPSCQPCVPHLGDHHRVNLIATSWCPPSCPPCVPILVVPILVSAILYTLCSGLSTHHLVYLVSHFVGKGCNRRRIKISEFSGMMPEYLADLLSLYNLTGSDNVSVFK